MMTNKHVFQKTTLKHIEFTQNGRDILLHFTDPQHGGNIGKLRCVGILEFYYLSNGFLNYADDQDSLFPLFVSEVVISPHRNGYELRIDAGLVIHIVSTQIQAKVY